MPLNKHVYFCVAGTGAVGIAQKEVRAVKRHCCESQQYARGGPPQWDACISCQEKPIERNGEKEIQPPITRKLQSEDAARIPLTGWLASLQRIPTGCVGF